MSWKIWKVPNASKFTTRSTSRCQQTAFNRAVLLYESAKQEQSVSLDVAYYGTTWKYHSYRIYSSHNMPASGRLLSDEWAVLQKEVNGVEDVPCRADAERVLGPLKMIKDGILIVSR